MAKLSCGVAKSTIVLESEFENTVIFLSCVHSCNLTDLEFAYFYTQYFKLSELEKACFWKFKTQQNVSYPPIYVE